MAVAPQALRLELLESFVVLSETLSFTRAAQVLFLSQSGLSRRIDALERAVGVQLFTRSTRRVRLTQHGRALLPHAASTIAQVRAGCLAASGRS